MLAVVAALGALLAGLATAPTSSAATAGAGHGWIAAATQTDGHLQVSGWAVDSRDRAGETFVELWVDGHHLDSRHTSHLDTALNAKYRLTGRHGFVFDVSYPRTARTATVVIAGLRWQLPQRAFVRLYTPGERIISVAKRYVGYPYVDGAAGPRAFDCSGFTRYVYASAHVATLIHNAEAQRHQARPISRSAARPGDLVFYLSGGRAYHVAIYAGNGMQYAAATPRDGVRYQKVWSSAVSYGTTWH